MKGKGAHPAFPVPAGFHRTETVVKRSRFIASFFHGDSPEAARAAIQGVREEFPNANHNCWAFAAGPPGETARVGMSDDGEPHNTAGRPMLNVLAHSGVGEIVVVVTRFFGGVKLGTGGLVRAYSDAVKTGLETLPLKEKRVMETLTIRISYAHGDAVKKLVAAAGGGIVSEAYEAAVTFGVELPLNEIEDFRAAVVNTTLGTVEIETP